MNKEVADIINDLKLLFGKEEILGKDFDNFLLRIKSDVVKNYLLALRNHSQPEQALKDAFFSANSTFSKFLFTKLHPEVGGESGFVDYLIKDEREEIKLEIKPLFEAEFEKGKSGEVFKKIKKVKLNWEKYRNQIRKYLGRRGEFVVFTNLEEWYFFSKSYSLDEDCNYFAKVDLFELVRDFEQIGDFWQYLDRQEELSVKEPLDKKFFNSLKTWVEELKKVKFTVDEKKKIELIIKLINKFIFIQTLDNFWVIKGKYLEEKWINIEREWQAKNKLRILKKFLSEINEYFYELYDTELFREGENGKTILDYIEKDDENIELFYNKLKLVLGIDYGTSATTWERGIIQYNFRRIDEDILGKAYETFLAEVRKEQGIYYTPKYITQYIVENTVGKIYDELLKKIKENLEKKNFDECESLIQRFASIRVLDPACGSGSFLIKALRLIWNKYNELLDLLLKEERKYSNFKNGLVRSKEDEENSEKISELRNIINFRDKRDLISKIIIRHIHGNDLDANALEVAKVNLWLEAIKLAPSEFRYDRLPADTNHILPDLEMNLGNGDSLVGLSENKTIEILKENYHNYLKRLFELRNRYLNDPTNEEAIKEINEIKKKLREKLDEEFKRYLEENDLPLEILEKTKPFHWALDFWFVFFDENLEPKPKEERGFDAVVGNPPYVRIQILNKESPEYVEYLNRSFETSFKNYDLAVTFIECGFKLTSDQGRFSYIVTSKWMQADYGEKLREMLAKSKSVAEIIDFGDQQVFDDATTYTVIPLLEKKDHEFFKYMLVKKLKKDINQLKLIRQFENYDDENIKVITVKEDGISKNPWTFSSQKEEIILEKTKKYKKLSYFADIFVGLQTSADPVYILELKKDLGNFCRVYSKSMKKGYVLEKDFLKPFLKGDEIKRWVVPIHNKVLLFPYLIKTDGTKREAYLVDIKLLKTNCPKTYQYLIDNKKRLEDREKGRLKGKPNWYGYIYEKNHDKFELPKIMIQVLAIRSTCALDEKGEIYFTGGGGAAGYGIILKENTNISLKYLLALLNSRLVDWFMKKISTVYRGGYYVYAKRFLEKIPIYEATPEQQTPIIKLVQKIITLKKLQHKFREVWRYYSRKFRDDYKSLGEILLNDKRKIQEGNFDKVWIKEASIYPDEQNELLEKEFKKFRIIGENDNKLKIYGIEGQKEKLLLEITTNKKEFRDIIYLELLELMDSRIKKKTLKDILSKSEISVIQPNIWEKSGNLVRITKQKFNEWLEKEKFDIKEDDIVKIDNEIQEIDNLIDAHVFKLYGLTKEEVEIVLDSLNVIESVKNDILRRFEGVK